MLPQYLGQFDTNYVIFRNVETFIKTPDEQCSKCRTKWKLQHSVISPSQAEAINCIPF
jgi:hypothetical protein